MPAALTHSTERLTWKQIIERYPETWIGMTDIKFRNDDGTNVESAVVYAFGEKYDVIGCKPTGLERLVMFTSPEKHALSNWMLWRA